MGRAAVFTWKGCLPPDEAVGADAATRYSGDYGEQWAYQATEPVAVAVLAAVRKLGHATDVSAPYFGEHAWHFDLRLSGRNYPVAVQWVGRRGRDDSFAAVVSVRRGWFVNLLSRPPDQSAEEPGQAILHAALSVCAEIMDLEWVNDAWVESPGAEQDAAPDRGGD
jgi:hypothetical protein